MKLAFGLAIISLLIAMIAVVIRSGVIYYQMIDRVNKKLPFDAQLPAIQASSFDIPKVLRTHREHFPDSREPAQMRFFQLLGFGIFFLVVILVLVYTKIRSL